MKIIKVVVRYIEYNRRFWSCLKDCSPLICSLKRTNSIGEQRGVQMTYLSRNAKALGFLVDLLMVIAAFYATYALLAVLLGHASIAAESQVYFKTQLLCWISWSIAVALFVEYPSRRQSGLAREIEIVLTTNSLAILMFGMSAFLFKVIDISRLFVASYLLVVVSLMFISRYIIRVLLYILRKSGWDAHTRIIVGTSVAATRYLEEIAADKRVGVEMLGYVGTNDELPGLRCLGSFDAINEVLKSHAPDGVVLALRVTDPYAESIIRACEKQGVSVELLLDGLSFQIASSSIRHGRSISSLYLSAIPHTLGSLFIKRLTDMIVSGVALIVLSPIFLTVAAFIKLEDGGPVLFKQQRVGLKGKSFWMYKFRSMDVNAEKMKSELMHLNEMSGPVFKLTDDPRVTRVGRVIRNLSLDELPQLFNVLVGNMSLVGPRPPLPLEVSSYMDEHRRRLSVKPGLTCLWQVSGRNDIDFEQWMNLDLAYIDNWSYLQDWKIIFRTIPAVIKRTGAR